MAALRGLQPFQAVHLPYFLNRRCLNRWVIRTVPSGRCSSMALRTVVEYTGTKLPARAKSTFNLSSIMKQGENFLWESRRLFPNTRCWPKNCDLIPYCLNAHNKLPGMFFRLIQCALLSLGVPGRSAAHNPVHNSDTSDFFPPIPFEEWDDGPSLFPNRASVRHQSGIG